MPTLFFMPWCELRDVLHIGQITVLPYERGKHPAPLGKTKQATLDAILGNYAERAYQSAENSTMPVKKALVLRWPGDDECDDLLPEAEIYARLQQVQFLVFAALSNRNFARGMDYCNADGLFVTAQHFSEDNPAATAISTRRRDGFTRHMVSGTRGKPIFLRPLHASDGYQISVERRFAEALLALEDCELRDKIVEAIMLFNRANTDASEVPPTAEVVFLRAALETLLGATHEAADLKAKLLALMAPHLGPIKWSDASFAPQVWKNKWKSEQRPFTAWVRDFCAWRNKGAHGTGGKQHSEPVWSLQNHLLFTSWFMSRAIKCLLVREGRYTLTKDDVDELANLEMFFAYDVMALDGLTLQWSTVLNHVQYLQLGRMLYESTKEDGSDD